MPTYLVTDKHTNTRVMVEAQRPQGALALLVADRFTLSPALEAAEAIRYTRNGVLFIEEGAPVPADPAPVQQPACEPTPLGVFGGSSSGEGLAVDEEAPEFAEVEPLPPSSSSWTDTTEGNDE